MFESEHDTESLLKKMLPVKHIEIDDMFVNTLALKKIIPAKIYSSIWNEIKWNNKVRLCSNDCSLVERTYLCSAIRRGLPKADLTDEEKKMVGVVLQYLENSDNSLYMVMQSQFSDPQDEYGPDFVEGGF